MAAYYRVYDSRHLLPRTAKNRDQLRNPTLGNRVWATFTFLVSFYTLVKLTFRRIYVLSRTLLR